MLYSFGPLLFVEYTIFWNISLICGGLKKSVARRGCIIVRFATFDSVIKFNNRLGWGLRLDCTLLLSILSAVSSFLGIRSKLSKVGFGTMCAETFCINATACWAMRLCIFKNSFSANMFSCALVIRLCLFCKNNSQNFV